MVNWYHRRGVDGGGVIVGSGVDGIVPFATTPPPFEPQDFYFFASYTGKTAQYQTSPSKGGKSIILPALGRIRLRLYDHVTTLYKYGAWSGYFVNSGDIGAVSQITGLVQNRTYTAEYNAQPDASVADDWTALGWTAFYGPFVLNADTSSDYDPVY